MASANEMIFDRLLTNIVVEKGMGQQGIAGALAPLVKSTTLTGQYMKRERSDTSAGVEVRRAPGEKVKSQARPGKTLVPFGCIDHVLKEPIPIEILAGAGEADLSAEQQNSAFRILWQIFNAWEEDVYNLTWADNKAGFQSLYGTSRVKDPTAKWGGNSAKIKKDILDLKAEIYKACGYVPSVGLLPNEVFNVITTEENELQKSLKYVVTGGEAKVANVTEQILAAYFELNRVLVPMYLADDKASGAEEKDFMWKGDHFGLFHIDNSSSRNKDTFLSTFYWEGGGQRFLGTRTGWDAEHKSQAVEVSAYFTVELVDRSCGGIITEVLD